MPSRKIHLTRRNEAERHGMRKGNSASRNRMIAGRKAGKTGFRSKLWLWDGESIRTAKLCQCKYICIQQWHIRTRTANIRDWERCELQGKDDGGTSHPGRNVSKKVKGS